jgi:hypothetical protein
VRVPRWHSKLGGLISHSGKVNGCGRKSAFEHPSFLLERTETLTERADRSLPVREQASAWKCQDCHWRQDADPHAGLEACRYVAAAILGCQ